MPLYSLEVEALFTWFPTRSEASLKEARMTGDTFSHSTIDFGYFGGGPRQEHSLDHEGILNVDAFIKIGVNQDGVFEADLELRIGPRKRDKRIVIRPDTRVPFMLNLPAADDDQGFKGTAVVLQGVFNASREVGESDHILAVFVGRSDKP